LSFQRAKRYFSSKQKVPLRHRQLLGRLADQKLAVRPHVVGFGIDLDLRRRVVQIMRPETGADFERPRGSKLDIYPGPTTNTSSRWLDIETTTGRPLFVVGSL
jgi:hypothetical protein